MQSRAALRLPGLQCAAVCRPGKASPPPGISHHSSPLKPARLSRNCDSSATGRPVAPLALPERRAVPAMSRCAQLYLRVKRDRKQPAVIAPPGTAANVRHIGKIGLQLILGTRRPAANAMRGRPPVRRRRLAHGPAGYGSTSGR